MMEKKKGKKKKTIIIFAIILVVFVFGAAGLKLAGGSGGGGIYVSAGVVERMDLEKIVTIRGVVEGSDSADVFSASNYRISSILVEEGDKVTKGQVLATLDAEDLQDQYDIAAINAADAKTAYESASILYEEGAISRSEYNAAKSAYEAARLTLSSFNLSEKANVTSPISGTITRVNCTVGRIAGGTQGSSPMFVIEDVDNLQMKVQISEYDISEIALGQTATISADVLGKATVEGTISKISPTGELKSAGSTEMVIPVTIDIDKGDTNLIAGVTAKAKILVGYSENALVVPIDALFENPDTGEKSIFIIENGVLSKKIVETGLEGDLYIELLNTDLDEGAQVLLSPTFEHYDGMPVNVM